MRDCSSWRSTCSSPSRNSSARAAFAVSLRSLCCSEHQLLISNRSRHRAPNLSTLDRFLLGLITLFVNPRRLPKLSAILKPATLFKFHKALVDRKYQLLFSFSPPRRKPGRKVRSTEFMAACAETKPRNPSFGCGRTAQQIAHAL